MADLSILIPARNEEFLQKTVEDIFEHTKGDTEVLVGIDEWDGKTEIDIKRGAVYKFTGNLGQRAMTNRLAEISRSKYLMKIDAHCSFSDGFDIDMMKDMANDVLLVPILLNLRPYRFVCQDGHIQPHSNKQPEKCNQCENTTFIKEIIWQTIPKPVTSSFYFDTRLVFQYCKEQSPSILSETMAIQGSGWMVSREKYWELELSDEKFGSWGQQGVEVACKTWLSGGRVLNTKRAYMSHWFRQSDEFPYTRDMKQVDAAYERSKQLFLGNNWLKQKHSIQWLIEKFNYPGDWSKEKVQELCKPWTIA